MSEYFAKALTVKTNSGLEFLCTVPGTGLGQDAYCSFPHSASLPFYATHLSFSADLCRFRTSGTTIKLSKYFTHKKEGVI